jgi:exopolysaccharide production protein ExoZ
LLNSIQVLRAFAAWLVVLHHCMQVFFNFKVSNIIFVAVSMYGSIGVDLFLCLVDL